MADITMCTGEGCPIREHCRRFTAPQNTFRQSWYAGVPWSNGGCDEFEQSAEKETKKDA